MHSDSLYDVVQCPVNATLQLIGGKWKMLVLYVISRNINRFGKMEMVMRGISKQMLTTQLRELERDGLITRVIYPVIPPKVEYFLTEKGESIIPILDVMKAWGEEHAFEPVASVA